MKRSVSVLLIVGLVVAMMPSFALATPAATNVTLPSVAPATAAPTLGYAPDSVIVGFKTPVTTTSSGKFAASHGLATRDLTKSANKQQLLVAVPSGETVDGFIADLESDPTVEYAERNYVRHATVAVPPNDPDYNLATSYASNGASYSYGRSWWLRDSGANTFWSNYNNTATDFPVRAANDTFKIAIIDTGFWMDHPDKGPNIVAGKDECQTYSHGVVTKDYDVTPVPASAPLNSRANTSHGTCVAGEVAAATNNAAGVASVGYDLQVRVYKVQGIWVEGDPPNGYPAGSAVMWTSVIVDAIYDATNDGCKVINMSLGGPGASVALQNAVDYAYAHGVVVIAATGNDGNDISFYPAACSNVVGAGSYELNGSAARVRSSFTNYGSQLDILAPGRLIYGLTDPTYDLDGASPAYVPGYEWWAGTSMASPAFAGMLAMVWRFAPALSNAEITSYMLDNATPQGAQPNTDFGYGYVNVAAAYAKLKADFPYLAKPSVTTTKTAYGSEDVNLAWNAVSGRSVQYRIVRDDSIASTQTAATLAYSGLAEGTHTVDIAPVSSYNWYDPASSATRFTFTVDKTAPVVSSIAYSSDQLTWADTEGANPHTTQIRIDSSATQTVTGNAYTIPANTLVDGSHTFYIAETDAVGNLSPLYSYVFSYVNPPPPPTTRYEETDTRIAYSGSWTSHCGPVYSGGSLRTAAGAGTGFTVAFDGTAIEWLALTGPTYGIAQVVLDGVAQPDVDLYSATYLLPAGRLLEDRPCRRSAHARRDLDRPAERQRRLRPDRPRRDRRGRHAHAGASPRSIEETDTLIAHQRHLDVVLQLRSTRAAPSRPRRVRAPGSRSPSTGPPSSGWLRPAPPTASPRWCSTGWPSPTSISTARPICRSRSSSRRPALPQVRTRSS